MVRIPSGPRCTSAILGASLLRDGELFQITHDHTVVQSLIDQGQLTAEEALSHPERALLLRALDGTQTAVPDLSLHDVRPGDRYLLCSDGLTTVVPAWGLHQVPRRVAEPAEAVRQAHQPGQLAAGRTTSPAWSRTSLTPPTRAHLVTNRLVGGAGSKDAAG